MSGSTILYADVVVELPVPKELTYSVPEEMQSSITEGCSVVVPLRNSKIRGYVISLFRGEAIKGVRPLAAMVKEMPPLPGELLETAREVSERYLYTWGDVLSGVVPTPPGRTAKRYRITDRGKAKLSSKKDDIAHKILELLEQEGELNAGQLQRRLKEKGIAPLLRDMQKRGWLSTSLVQSVEEKRDASFRPTRIPAGRPHLIHARAALLTSDEEASAWERVKEALDSRDNRPLLLQSPSLEEREKLYILAAEHIVRQGGSVIILKPEIAVTLPFIEKLNTRFHGNLFISHSGLTPKERWNQCKKGAEETSSVIVGTRAAVLQPVKNLSLMIVDEEHDEAYKQEEIPRYHTREVALIRGKKARCAVMLGASVPSMESLYRVEKGEIEHVELAGDGAGVEPGIEIVDLKQAGSRGAISSLLEERVGETLAKGGRALLFLNRRGYATFIQCKDCGFALRCPQCDISLTYHTQSRKARCRYCRHEESTLLVCPGCGGSKILYLGMGTQKVEQEVCRLFPDASICRFDSDVVKETHDQSTLVERIRAGEFRVVVGTQIVMPYLQQLDFSLTAVISADAILNLPDFRSAEKCFRLVHQLAGAGGRKNADRKVVVQSFNPEHYSLYWAQKLDYKGFYREEMERRGALEYPPVTRMISLRIEGGPDSGAASLAVTIAGRLRSRLREDSEITIMGPTVVHLARTRSKTRWQILLKGEDGPMVEKLAKWALDEYSNRSRNSKKPQVSVDVDPVSLF